MGRSITTPSMVTPSGIGTHASTRLQLTRSGSSVHLAWDDDGMSEGNGNDVGRAPICPSCGVTALPAETSNVIDSVFVCENPDCDAFGETVEP
jgi:hypothetical protein